MDRELLKAVILDQREYRPPKDYFIRSQSALLRSFVDNPHTVIVSGIRRSGKSTLVKNLQDELPESDYFINFDDDRLVQFKLENFQSLLEVFIELFGPQNTFYFDEIQNIKGWEFFVRRLHDQGYKIFITGSNANLLSRELGTHLTGRFLRLEVYPLSFKEIVLHRHPEIADKKNPTTTDRGLLLKAFSDYLIEGGIPDFVKYGQPEYLKSLYESILYRDVIVRHSLHHEKPMRELVYYFASNVGKEFSYTQLSKMLGIGSANTITDYCGFLEDCYLCFFINRYSHSLQKQIHYHKKCYMIDSALIRLIGFRVSEDKGRLLENIVLLELKRRGREVFFHKRDKECDFVIREGTRIVQAIQVTAGLYQEATRQRELAGLLEAMEDYQLDEGLILTENESETLTLSAGEKTYRVEITPLWKWLLIS